jgi:trigger factor
MVQEQIDNDIAMSAEEVEVDRAAAENDVIYADIEATKEGSSSSTTDSIYLILGEEDYGADFDKEMTGVSTGDHLTFTVTFDDDIWMDEWVDSTVTFDVTVTEVAEQVFPEYNDEYVSEYTGFDTTEEYEAYLRESLEEQYNSDSYSEVCEDLFMQVEDTSVFSSIPEDFLAECKEDATSNYTSFFEGASLDDIYALFGLSDSDLDDEAQTLASRRLLVEALCEANNLEVTEDDYIAYLNEKASELGYLSLVEYEASAGRRNLVWNLYEEKAFESLYASADITMASGNDIVWDEDEIILDGEDDIWEEDETETIESES